MRIAVTVAVLLAVLATALVAVCQRSEIRHLQYRVWQLERRRERLERMYERLTRAIEATRTPRRLLLEHDGRPQAPAPLPREAQDEDPAAPAGAPWLLAPQDGGAR